MPEHRATLQPLLHDLVTCIRAPTVALSGADGQIRGRGAQGVLRADVRVLSRAELRIGGHEPEAIAGRPHSVEAGTAQFTALVRSLGDPGPDPTVRVDRTRRVDAAGLTEDIRISSTARTVVTADVEVVVAADLASIEAIKSGTAEAIDAVEVVCGDAPDSLIWGSGQVAVSVTADRGRAEPAADGRSGVLRWRVTLAPRTEQVFRWRLSTVDTGAVVTAAQDAPTWCTPVVSADDRRLPALLRQSLADLDGLRMAPADQPGDTFLAAGAPWFLTLFGRDSLWAARMLLPLGTDLAAGTLRALATRQGTRVDDATAEAPGKIPHEVRRATAEYLLERIRLPPLYYGTVDATPLWVCLLRDAWRWGMAESEVAALLPHLTPALDWMPAYGDADGDGFLEYVDASGHGLANQGWKDSGDSVRFADGSIATGPVALCEVQGYAYEAALAGADLLDAFGRQGADRWRQWAADLAGRFRERFWVTDATGPFPALAMDGAKRPVDSLTSNIGHLLGTGILNAAETALVVDRVTGSDMDSGYGLRTMSSNAGGYAPLSYHCGSVWPHDTAIVIAGLARSGHADRASGLVEGLLAAGADFGWRLPELYSGDRRDDQPAAIPYPAACRPQAWSAAAAVAVLGALVGLDIDVPAGRISAHPAQPSPVGALRVEGLSAGGNSLNLEIDRDGVLQPPGG